MSTLKEKIAVMQAAEMGSTIQRAVIGLHPDRVGPWADCLNGPVWNWDSWEYRVKPTPPQYRIFARPATDEHQVSPWVAIRNSRIYFNTPLEHITRMESAGALAITPWLDLPEKD